MTCRLLALCLLAAALGALPASAPLHAQASAPKLTPELEKLRTALEKYQDPVQAIHDGYFSTLGCVHFPKAGGHGEVAYVPGGMGVHFLNPALVGPQVDPTKPQVLLYEPDGDKLRLVGAEWFVPLATGVKERPTLSGRPFDGPMEGHPPLLPVALHHYDLHVWLWKENPAGLYSPTNPNVKCPPGAYTFDEKAPKVVSHH